MKRIFIFLQYCSILGILCLAGYSQSSNIDYPTPITSNSISARINARDIGDPRATVHYYVFEGNQGDIFLNVESRNLNGDIDIFYADNLRPLTKISLFAESAPTRTGREIYLRKFERLILRVEGRTPTDEPATYSINFTGSFSALKPGSPNGAPLPSSGDDRDGEVRVNSVGTILDSRPKPKPTPREIEGRNSRQTLKTTTTPQPVSTIKTPKSSNTDKVRTAKDGSDDRGKKVEVIVTDNLRNADVVETEQKERKKESATLENVEKSKSDVDIVSPLKRTNAGTKSDRGRDRRSDQTRELAEALENVRLVVEFKDGARIQRPMNEVLRFGIDKGVLTIVNKNGSIGRYSILEILRITVE